MDVVIGYDINEYYAQITCAAKGAEPETLEFPSRKEGGNIETALCKRKGVNQWFCGKEAVKKGVSGEGYLVEHLWRLLGETETIEIEKQEYPVVSLCNLFLSRTLGWALQRMEELYGEPVKIKALVLTGEPWREQIHGYFDELTKGLSVEAEHIVLQSHEDSLFAYMVQQPQRMLGYETGVFDLTGETLISYRVEMNHKTKPIVTTIQKEYVNDIVKKKHYASIMEHDEKTKELDLSLKSYAEKFTGGRIVTALYLIGEGFSGDWYKESLKVLCRNRKVFAGNNLFGKGACYAAGARAWDNAAMKEFIFFGKDMLRYNVGVSMWKGQEEEYVPLLDAGTNWYDAKAEITFMMEEAETIELLITPIDGRGAYKEMICLPKLPERPYRCWRFSMNASMQSERRIQVQISDEGFGDMFEKIPVEMTYDLILGREGNV